MSDKVFITVATFDMASGKESDRRTIDFSRSRARAWLTNHMYHAFKNGKGVQVFNEIDKDAEDKLSRTEALTLKVDASEAIEAVEAVQLEFALIRYKEEVEALVRRDMRLSLSRSQFS